jgi:hypothetical protein
MTAMLRPMRWLLFILFSTGCEDLLKGGSGLGLATTEGCVETSSGAARVNIDINNRESAFLLTAKGEHLVAVDEILDEDGERVFYWEDWYTLNTYLTSAIWPNTSEMVLNWPIRGEEAHLSKGIWTVILSAVNGSGQYQSGSEICYTVQSKEDDDLEWGEVNVRLVYAEGVGEMELVTEAMDAAIERWNDIWAPMGLIPVVRIENGDFSKHLPYAGDGSESIYDLTLESYEDEITMMVGETIAGGTSFLGVAGGIPGTLTANTRSAVVMSWLAGAGSDGVFSDIEISILGETMAHEVGHFMGLFHPVEQTWSSWDACDDTPNCSSASTCESQLGDNLMFPAPICDFSTCIDQDQLSDIQTEILHRYTGAL